MLSRQFHRLPLGKLNAPVVKDTMTLSVLPRPFQEKQYRLPASA